MPDAYRETLHRWAAQYVPEGATVTGVEIEHGNAVSWSEVTSEDAYLYVTIKYTLNGQPEVVLKDDEEASKLLVEMGQLLGELFAIEEAQ